LEFKNAAVVLFVAVAPDADCCCCVVFTKGHPCRAMRCLLQHPTTHVETLLGGHRCVGSARVRRWITRWLPARTPRNRLWIGLGRCIWQPPPRRLRP
jgi:hypothetical protein